MNVVLETFERVLYPSGGAATRRASASGFSAHNQQQHTPTTDRPQMPIGGRRRSGGGDGGGAANTSSRSMPASAAFNCLTVFDPLKGCSTERELMRGHSNGIGAEGGGGEVEPMGSKAPNRSRSIARRKKSAGSHPRKQSMVSLLFSLISSSPPSAQNRRRNRPPPPRQWSVPERGSLGPDSEDEPFRLVQKAPSASLSPSSSYSNQRTPPTKRLSSREDGQTDRIVPTDGRCQFVLFGFAAGQSSLNRFSSDISLPLFESHFLARLGQIQPCPPLSRALFLRCMDPKPLYPFLHYAIFDSCETGAAEMAEKMNRMSMGHAEFVSFEEVIALERQANAIPLGSSVHCGFIVLCFRLLGGQTDSNSQLENTWLSWTGAHEIYKHSPRSWQLRRLSLLRRVPFSAVQCSPSPSSSPFAFAYVLLCEFGSLLHPDNALAALDMCERLRTRNCGTVSLYRARHLLSSNLSAFSPSSSSPNNGHFSSPTNSLSPHWSPQQIRQNAAAPHRLARMGYSQEVPDSGRGMAQRRTMLLRMRERSLGWDDGSMGTAL